MTRTPNIWFIKALILLLSGLVLISFSMHDAKAQVLETSEQMELRNNIVVTGQTITLGDLFSNAGDAADIYVSNSPQLGKSSSMSVLEILPIVERYELNWQRPVGVSRINIKRRSQILQPQELKLIVRDAILRDGGPNKFIVTLYGNFQNIHLPVDVATNLISVNMVTLDVRTGRFNTTLNLPQGNGEFTVTNLTGRIEELISVPVLSATAVKDDIIRDNDISWVDLPKQRLSQNILLSTDSLIGMAARRTLRADTPLRQTDVQEPVLIRKGTLVAMEIRSGPMRITSMGRALEDGGKNDIIKIVNIDSHKTIEGRVVGTDSVAVLYYGNLTGTGQ